MTDGGSIFRWVLIVSVAVVLQIGLVSQIRPAGVHPELLLLLSICAGLVSGSGTGAGVGFACGLVLDLFVPGHMGTTALSYVLIGYGAGVAGDAVARPTRSIQAGIVALASIAGVLLYAAIGELLGQRSLSDPNLAAIVGIVAACNAVLAVPVLAVCRWADPEREQRLRTR